MARRYGFELMNLSFVPSKAIAVNAAGRTLDVKVPAAIFEDADLFITVPVPKIHANTVVSMSVKNQARLRKEVTVQGVCTTEADWRTVS